MNLVAHYELQMLQIMLVRFQFIEREGGGGRERVHFHTDGTNYKTFYIIELLTVHFTYIYNASEQKEMQQEYMEVTMALIFS